MIDNDNLMDVDEMRMRILMNPVQNLLITIHTSMTLNLMMMTSKLEQLEQNQI